MIKEAIGFGATTDAAKEAAVAKLNAADDADIQYEVVSTPKKKTLGIFGGRLAEVRAFIELPDEKPKTAKKAPQKTEKKTENDVKPEAKPAKKPVIEKKEKAEAVHHEKNNNSQDEGWSQPIDISEVSADSRAAIAANYLKKILAGLGCQELSIKISEKENAARIDLDGDQIGTIIGHRGETLDSLQYLAGLAASNSGGYYKVSLNIGKYREKREETLINLAKRVSAQVIKTGKNRSLEPMNPYERRIIHTAVQEIEGVVSNSFGTGASRRVVISVEGSDPHPPKRELNRRDNRSRTSSNTSNTSNRPAAPKTADRTPKKDSDVPLYGKIN